MLNFGPETLGDLDTASAREWLVTNGIGGYAAGTVSGMLRRSYHGLLIAALEPPLGRTLTVTKLDATATLRDIDYDLFVNQWSEHSIEPYGHKHISRFSLDGTTPVWVYSFGDATLDKRLWMEPGANTTYTRYTLHSAPEPVRLSIKIMANYRDHHGGGSEGMWQIDPVAHGLRFVAFNAAHPFYVLVEGAKISPRHIWYKNYYKALEAYRGENVWDNHLYAGHIDAVLEPGQSLTVVAALDSAPDLDGNAAFLRRQEYDAGVLAASREDKAPPAIRQLVLAADQFIVKRATADFPDGRSVIAGYPWFGDWGRDTMIALPGLTLATGRPEIAARILRTYAHFVDKGMIPNRFPDEGEIPEYNTVDATLWFFEAVRAYYAFTQDDDLVRDLFPVLEEIIRWHMRGTRYGIRMDTQDGLLYAGEAGVQLTWMDVKIADWVVTPRTGKPVEVNALWHNALCSMVDFARLLDSDPSFYDLAAQRVRENFGKFWNEAFCYDVIGGPGGKDAALRPNQLIAVSLPNPLLTPEQQKAVVDLCERRLLTPRGLRSLDRDDPNYIARYGGDRAHRDPAYHQGTVWSWLIGPFVEAHLRVYGDKARARAYLLPVLENLDEAVVGSISEIFDAEPPHHPRGAFAQAWAVAEILRVWQLVRE